MGSFIRYQSDNNTTIFLWTHFHGFIADGTSGLYGRSERLKMDGHVTNWKLQKPGNGRSAKVDGPEMKKYDTPP